MPDPDTGSKRPQTLFLQTLTTRGPSLTEPIRIKQSSYDFIQNSCSEYFWNFLIQILFGAFRYQSL